MNDATRLGAIVLAAGASTRMGRPKASIEWRGATFLSHVVALARAGGCSPIVVVSGAVEVAAVDGCVVCHNPDWRHGQLSSLQAGLRTLVGASAPLAGCLVLTVDRPAIRAATVQELVAHWREAPDGLWQPRLEGRSGHPLIYPADLFAPLLALAPDASARALVRSPGVALRRRFLDVDDPGVCHNVDTPADLAALGM